jgi:hypothetical protein
MHPYLATEREAIRAQSRLLNQSPAYLLLSHTPYLLPRYAISCKLSTASGTGNIGPEPFRGDCCLSLDAVEAWFRGGVRSPSAGSSTAAGGASGAAALEDAEGA